MKKHSIGSRILSVLLSLAMILPMLGTLPETVDAAVGDLSNVSTGLTGNIDTADTISLPIKILDYENDGMLFEFAEAIAVKDAADFGATWAADFASQTAVGNITTSMYGDFWSNTTKTLNTSNSYASFLRATWAKNSEQAPHTVYGRTGVIMPNDFDLSMDNARYLVLVYRSNVSNGKIGFFVERENSDRNQTRNRVGDLNFTNTGDTGEGSTTNWTYAVYDLKQGDLANAWTGYGNAKAIWTTLPMDASGEYIDLAHAALFANKDQAKAFGEYALTDGSDRGDNRGFGLLRSSRNQSGGTNYAGVLDETTTVEEMNTYGDTTSIDFSTLTTLGYTLLGTFKDNGIANVGLLESSLSAEGYPVYKEEVVTYVANLLKHSLEIPERTSDGWKNYRYVKGTVSSVYGNTDLASALRTKIKNTMGSYAAASGKDLVGTWAEVGGNIASYYDAAYFLLNSIFVPGSYNVEQDDYNYLVLSAGTDSDTNAKVYVFDGGFSTSATPADAKMAIDYNATNKTIQNTSAAGKAHFVYEGQSTTTLNPFLPVTDRNTADGMTFNPYYQDDGIINGVKKQETMDTTYERNYNFAMVSEGEFTYYADDELFFEFEGDDDVYLFINGELVMDIGSAHSIDGVRFNLNDYVNAAKAGTLGSDNNRNTALALEEGNTYTFKFYYMERHSYGSNIRIETNIRVTDPSMVTAKTAWQDGTQLDFGSIVDKDKVVEYGFSITNNGEENLYNLTFTDNDIGIKLDPIAGLTVTGNRVYDVNGGTLEASDLTAIVTHPDYDDITVTFAGNDGLKSFLYGLNDGNDGVGTEDGEGLYIGATVLFRGIGYKLTDTQIAAGVFDNTVQTTATNSTVSKTLYGQATMRVFVPADPMYYEWAGHELVISKNKLITDVLAAANQPDNILSGEVPSLTTSNVDKIELVTKAGTAITSPYVSVDSSYNLTINYPTAGSKVFYVKVTYNSSKNTVIVPVLVNVTNVVDSTFVLDYGLPVVLFDNSSISSDDELTKNDTLTVPGRTTEYSVLGIGTNPNYSSNEITFALDATGKIEGDYGTFEFVGNKLTYTPNRFIEGPDTIYAALNVYESDLNSPSNISGTLDINNEVEMYKAITILPANVMYYEDNFHNDNSKYSIHIDKSAVVSVESDTEDDTIYQQSADQNSEYGNDPIYQVNTNTKTSANTRQKISLNNAIPVASFTFTGTGFEIIAETNATDTGIVSVEADNAIEQGNLEIAIVKNSTTDGSATPWSRVLRIPVITEFDNNADGGTEAIYQVPIIRKDLTNLPNELGGYGDYTVTINAVPTYDFSNPIKDDNGEFVLDENQNKTYPLIDTYLYLDGVRIYNPLGQTGHDAYPTTEKGAEFHEVRKLIQSGDAGVITVDESGNLVIGSATATWTENLHPDPDTDVAVGTKVSSVDDYMYSGPNNEAYMYGECGHSALVFYVKETGEESDPHSLQIAVRAIDDASFFAGIATPDPGLNAVLRYGITLADNTDNTYNPGDDTAWANLAALVSSTEQYYTIDYTKCPYIENKGYQVVIAVNSGMVSFTSIKTVGLDITPTTTLDSADTEFESATYYYVDGTIVKETADGTQEQQDSSAIPAFYSIFRQMESDVVVEEESTDNIIVVPDFIIPPYRPIPPEEEEPDYPDEDETYTIRGTVTSYGDNTADVLIQLIPDGETDPAYEVTVTGNETEYVIADVKPGKYVLTVSKSNHVTRTYVVSVGTAE